MLDMSSQAHNDAQFSIALSEPSVDDPHFGYLVDLYRYTLDEGEGTSRWIQAFPYGEWSHPEYGKIKMDADRAARMAAGINQGIRSQDLPVNYDHGEQRKDAAGWIQRADVRPDGLWLLVDWTREAFQKIRDKGYKYFSPEYANAWKHPASGQVFKDVFFGGALTNMPHLKGILPLNLAEHVEEAGESSSKTTVRSLMETYAAMYGITFDESTTDESLKNDIVEKFGETNKPPAEVSIPVGNVSENSEQPGSTLLEFKQADWSRLEIMSTDPHP